MDIMRKHALDIVCDLTRVLTTSTSNTSCGRVVVAVACAVRRRESRTARWHDRRRDPRTYAPYGTH